MEDYRGGPWDAQPAEAGKTNWWKWLGIGCGAVVLLTFLCCGSGLVWFAMQPEGGARLANNMEPYAVDYLADHALLDQDENLVAYYDVTISMSGAEAAILTDERLIYHAPHGDTVIQLDEITDIRHRYEDWIGDVIQVEDEAGQMMVIEIAPLNNGTVFVEALKKQAERHGYEP